MISYEFDSGIAVVTIERAERANALDAVHWEDLAAAVSRADDERARVVLLTGAGRTFCAGGDLNEKDYLRLLAGVDASMAAIGGIKAPVVAYVNGLAIGAGLQIVVACDLRVGSPTSRFAIPAAAISKPAHPTLIQRIVAHAGVGAARAMLLGGEQLEATRAHQLGLLDRIGTLEDALEWATAISGYAPLVLEFFKRELAIEDDSGTPRYELFLEHLLASDDYAEALRAHDEGRAPKFTGK